MTLYQLLSSFFNGPALGVQGALPWERLQLQDVRIEPGFRTKLRSRAHAELQRTFYFRNAGVSYNAVPLVASNMIGVGTLGMARALRNYNMLVTLEKNTDIDSIITFLKENDGKTAIPTTGFRDGDDEKIRKIFEGAGSAKPKFLAIDVPNGHMDFMIQTVKKYRKDYPGTIIIAGNVISEEMSAEIINAGADIVKIGIGPGAACETKNEAGVHSPQHAAVVLASRGAHKRGGFSMADGGMRTPGDVMAALGASADFAMVGSELSGYYEGEEAIHYDAKGQGYIKFMGSSSLEFMVRTMERIDEYRSPEGKVNWKKIKGSIEKDGSFPRRFKGGFASAISYVGAGSAEEFNAMARRTARGRSGLNITKANIHATTDNTITPEIVRIEANPYLQAQNQLGQQMLLPFL